MEDLAATKKNSLELNGADSMQAETGSRQIGVGIPAEDGVAVCFGARAARSTIRWLILGVVFGLCISSVGATADRPALAGAYWCSIESFGCWATNSERAENYERLGRGLLFVKCNAGARRQRNSRECWCGAFCVPA